MKNYEILKKVRPLIGFVGVLMILLGFNAGNANATNYYVSSTAPNRSDSNTGLAGHPWKTVAKVNGLTFAAGDTVFFEGSFSEIILDPGNGSSTSPIVFKGTGPNSGRAVIKGITFTSVKYVKFLNFEVTNPGVDGIIRAFGSSTAQHITFDNLYIHDAKRGVYIASPNAKDLTFINTAINQMQHDGVMLSDPAGDRFKFINGAIINTGTVAYISNGKQYGTHGVYASGGTGHVFDGVAFDNNNRGWSVSIRRGGITIRNCTFRQTNTSLTECSGGMNNCNEDEATGINPDTGSRAKNQYYMIYRNKFMGISTAIYQSNNNDSGTDDPGNTWAVFNNTFVNTKINFSSYAKFYDIYMRNNAFVSTTVTVGTANAGKVHVLSNNGWYNSGTAQGTANVTVTTNPLDAQYDVTATSFRNVGVTSIAPAVPSRDMAAVTMVADNTNPLYYFGTNPDIGKNEYDEGSSNIIPTATIVSITTSPYNNETSITFKGNGTDTDGTIQGYNWTSNINGGLGTTATLSNIYLTVGTHQISFKVKDNSGAWSNPVTQTIVVNNANGVTAFSEYFNSTNSFTAFSGNWTLENSIYSQNLTANASNTNSYASVSQPGKMIYEWEMNFVTAVSGGMHIMCSVGNTDFRGNSYLIYQMASKLQIYYTDGTALTKIAETTETTWAATTNVTYKYKAVYDPSTGLISIYRNRTLALTATAPAIYTTGAYISLRSNNSHVHFDNIIVTRYSNCTPPSGTGTISGTTTVCQGTSAVSYTVSGISNATSYTWTLPSGATGTSTTNTISVNYGTSATSGNVTVQGLSTCGNSTIATLAVTVNPRITGTGIISGPTTVTQGQSNAVYTVSGISNATSYTWMLPSGATGSSTTNTITVNFSTSATSENVTVQGLSTCGNSAIATLAVTVNAIPTTYYEDFSDGVANNFVASSGTWAVESNQYSQSDATNTNTIASVPVNQAGKYVYQWKVNFESSSAAGMHIMCDASTSTNRGNSYLVFQTNTMLQIYESVGNDLTKKAEASCSTAAGQSHTYLVIYDPATGIINAYRDGSTTPIVSWTDDTAPLTSGSYISLRTNSTHAHFDNISVDYALYSEDFSDGVANNFVASSGTWAVESNQYSQNSTTNSNTIASVPVIQYGKLVYEWKTDFITSTSAGMHIMCDAPNGEGRGNSYLVFQTGTMLQIYESIGNTLTKKTEASCTAAAGQSHAYKVIYDPATGYINAYRDGGVTAIATWHDDSPLISGSYISLRTNSTHAHFDDLSVKIYNNSTKSALENEDVKTETEVETDTKITFSCYPNPFSSSLNISYAVPEDGNVLIQIYDFTGRVISKVINEKQAAGSYNVVWNSDKTLTSGIYFCRIVVNGNSTTSKIMLLK